MTAPALPTGRIDRDCKLCGKAFSTTAWERRQGKGIYCGRECSNASKRKPTASPPAHQRPPTIGKPQRDWEMDGGSTVSCARCLRERQRGVRCSCERPMFGED